MPVEIRDGERSRSRHFSPDWNDGPQYMIGRDRLGAGVSEPSAERGGGLDPSHGRGECGTSAVLQAFQHKDDARSRVRPGILASRSVDGSAELFRKLDRGLDPERAVGGLFGEGRALEQDVAREVVGLAFEPIRDLGGQGLPAILKEPEHLAVPRDVVVPGLVQLEKRLLGLHDSTVNVDEAFASIVEPQNLAHCGLDALSRGGGLTSEIRDDRVGIERASGCKADLGRVENLVDRNGVAVPGVCAVEEPVGLFLDRAKVRGVKSTVVRSCHAVASCLV